MKIFNLETKKICNANGIRFIPTIASFPPDTTLLKDDVHYTPKGARVLAKLVSSELVTLVKDNQLLEKP